jgi:cytochrome-b5 reductase
MESVLEQLQNDQATQVGVAFALVAVVAGAAFLFYVNRKTTVLVPEKWLKFKCVKKDQVSHNVVKLRFALPTPTSVLGLPIGQHISCMGFDSEGVEVIRPYTPTTLDSDVGYFELVVKVYKEGKVSAYFGRMKEGEFLAAKGPKGRFKYLPNQVREFGMVAGGTGITPMYQVARAILENPKDKTKISLIYANVTYEDILLKNDLDRFARDYPDQFKVYYVLNEPPTEWDGGVGFVTKDMIEKHCPPPAADVQILRCGPPPMNRAIAGHCEALGFTKEMQFQF